MSWKNSTYFQYDTLHTSGLALAANVEWPTVDWGWWVTYSDQNSEKYASRSIHTCSDVFRLLLDRMMIHLPDRQCKGNFPDISLHGAGLHEIPPKGFIRNHVDALEHPTKNWRRELTLILYLNPDWKEEWGGAFCINNKQGEVLEKIYPEHERLLIFRPTLHTYHSVEPVCGTAPSRKTLTLFYWSECEKRGLNAKADFGGKNEQAY